MKKKKYYRITFDFKQNLLVEELFLQRIIKLPQFLKINHFQSLIVSGSGELSGYSFKLRKEGHGFVSRCYQRPTECKRWHVLIKSLFSKVEWSNQGKKFLSKGKSFSSQGSLEKISLSFKNKSKLSRWRWMVLPITASC